MQEGGSMSEKWSVRGATSSRSSGQCRGVIHSKVLLNLKAWAANEMTAEKEARFAEQEKVGFILELVLCKKHEE